jgi:hypothetical protein
MLYQKWKFSSHLALSGDLRVSKICSDHVEVEAFCLNEHFFLEQLASSNKVKEVYCICIGITLLKGRKS